MQLVVEVMVVPVPVRSQVVDRTTMEAMQLQVAPMETSMSMPCLLVPVVVADGWLRGVLVVVPLKLLPEVRLRLVQIFLPMVARVVVIPIVLLMAWVEVSNSGLMHPTHSL